MSLDRIEEKIDKLIEVTQSIRIEAAKNTVDLRHHIKRTDILEKQQTKIIYLLLIGAGIGIALYGPDLIKLIKVII
jgi:hypothetical protein